MKITGNDRPFANTVYPYSLSDKGVIVKVKEWRIEYNGKIIDKKSVGSFKFHINLAGKTVKLSAIVQQNIKEYSYSIDLKIFLGKPRIEKVEWQDSQGKAIGSRKVGYLDKVQLSIKTTNIPKGDPLKISVFEYDKLKDRPMQTTSTSGVNANGYAYLNFENISLYQDILNKKDTIDESDHEFYVKIEYRNQISTAEDNTKLVIQNDDKPKSYIDKPVDTNQPVVVAASELPVKNKKIGKDFTFGIFIDGTLNNMYNTEMKQKLIDKKKPQKPTGLNNNISELDFRKVYKKQGDKDYSESSYENDLSNPAILFKNYTADETSVFKIYTEGIGTHSAPKNQGGTIKLEEFKGDDNIEGPAFGMGNAGIEGKVKKSIIDVILAIKRNIDKNKQYINTITFDVFGFSRGAAAARHFVHVVKYGAYKPEVIYDRLGNASVWDLQGYSVPKSYANTLMPTFGVLGQLLNDDGLLDAKTKIDVRFVGIFDTVPHFGGKQSNDVKDLGLDSVNKASYVVHMVAADEYRSNFDLVKISSVPKTSASSGKKGGVELIFPGVHCDVGGAYSEGGENRPYRINVSRSKEDLEEEKKEFVNQGWFLEQEMSVPFYASGILLAGIAGKFYRLEGYKKKVSNQYSYIPLHIMAQFCTMKNAPINKTKLREFKNFKENWIEGNVDFLQKLREFLWDYSFNGKPSLLFYKEKLKPIIDPMTGKLDDENIKHNAEERLKNYRIRFLRYHYLHWNATYGDPQEKWTTWISGKNKPNMDGKIRIRNVH